MYSLNDFFDRFMIISECYAKLEFKFSNSFEKSSAYEKGPLTVRSYMLYRNMAPSLTAHTTFIYTFGAPSAIFSCSAPEKSRLEDPMKTHTIIIESSICIRIASFHNAFNISKREIVTEMVHHVLDFARHNVAVSVSVEYWNWGQRIICDYILWV